MVAIGAFQVLKLPKMEEKLKHNYQKITKSVLNYLFILIFSHGTRYEINLEITSSQQAYI